MRYGYGYSYDRFIPRMGGFNPLNINGLQLYMNKNLGVNTKVAADFDTTNDLSSSSTDFNKADESFSFGGWVNWDSLGFGTGIIGKWGNGNNKKSYALYKNSANVVDFRCSSTGSDQTLLNAFTATSGTWYFIVCVYDSVNDLMKISVDGGAFLTTAFAGGVYNDGSPVDFRLGRLESANELNGKEDGMFFYDEALSLAEVQSLYNSGDGVSYNDADKTNLVSWYELNETSGTRYDAHGTNNLTDNNSVGYALGKIQEPTEVGELVSQWVDQSSNMYIFPQDTITAQPVLTVNGVDFDGISDVITLNSAPFVGDSSGIMFFSGYYDNAATSPLINQTDSSGLQTYWTLDTRTTGEVSLSQKDGTTQVRFTSTDLLTNGQFFYGWVKSDGSTFTMSLNGVMQTLIFASGTNNGVWFSYAATSDIMNIGALKRTTLLAGIAETNKFIYSNAALSDSEIAKIDNFMSDPNN